MSAPTPDTVERWLAEFGLQTLERAERDGVTSWDLVLDGQLRFDVRLTLILDPSVAVIVWVQYAPPINDAFRKSYRRLLRWNDEFPFVKFTISEDERPILTVEIPIERLGRDELGLAVARALAVCDRLVDESVDWLWPDGRRPDVSARASRGAALLHRFRAPLGELGASADRPEERRESSDSRSDKSETRPVAAETR